MMTDGNSTDTRREHFTQALDRFGPNLDLWPHGDRQDALALLRDDADAAQQWQAARTVHETLATPAEPDPAFDLALRRHVLNRLADDARSAFPRWWVTTAGSMALAASLMIGFWAGASVPNPDDSETASVVFGMVQTADLGDLQ